MEPENEPHRRGDSYEKPSFLGSMLVFGGVEDSSSFLDFFFFGRRRLANSIGWFFKPLVSLKGNPGLKFVFCNCTYQIMDSVYIYIHSCILDC